MRLRSLDAALGDEMRVILSPRYGGRKFGNVVHEG